MPITEKPYTLVQFRKAYSESDDFYSHNVGSRATVRIFSDPENTFRDRTITLRSILFAGKIITEFMVEYDIVNNFSSNER